jgi:8-amino-7-oxononanoate synthase
MNERLLNKLIKRKASGTLRTLQIPETGIDFFSNDYIGLSKINIPTSKEPNGSTGSRLLSGNSPEAERCELKLAKHFKAEAALIYNSGYAANIGLLSAILQRGDLVFYDQYVHASSRDGLRLSLAESTSFKHNDIEDLCY